MDEISALKFIFKSVDYNTDKNEIFIKFGEKEYFIDEETRNSPGFLNVYNFVMKEESKISIVKNEETKEIISDYKDVIKITEEQFSSWLNEHRRTMKKDENLTGKKIWESLKGEERKIDHV